MLAWPAGRRARFAVLGLWLVALVLAAPLAGRLEQVQTSDPLAALAPGAESTQVAELLRTLPGTDQIPAVIGYERTGGLTPVDLARVPSDRDAITADGVGVGEVTGPVPSDDGSAVLLVVPLTSLDPDALATDVATLRDIVEEGDAAGLTVRVTGGAGITADLVGVFAGINGTLLIATALVVAILLLLTYRSPFLWLLPLVTVFLADFLARAGMTALVEQGGLFVDGQIAGIVLVLVFGAGTDYALLLVARYREELRRYADRGDAMAAALAGAGPAIVASAATVALALLCLLTAVLPGQRALGPAGAIGVLCAMLAALTQLPALMLVSGRRVFWPFVPRYGTEESTGHGAWDRLGGRVARHPRRVWVGGLAVPADSDAAYATVERLRVDLDAAGSGTALVGGTSAQAVDERDAQKTGRERVIPLVLGVVLLVLVLLLRSVVAPLLLVGTVVLSFAASLGVTAWLSDLLGFGSFNPTLPLFAFVFLVALGVDYNIFLMTRAREEAVLHGTRDGMLRALALTGGVITSAGLVLAATFAVLGVLPLVALAQLGFVVGFGVLLDTLVVRTLVVPGLVLDLGDRVWWPAKGFGRGAAGHGTDEPVVEVSPARV